MGRIKQFEYTTLIPWRWWNSRTGGATEAEVRIHFMTMLEDDPDVIHIGNVINSSEGRLHLGDLPTAYFDPSRDAQVAIGKAVGLAWSVGLLNDSYEPNRDELKQNSRVLRSIFERHLLDPDPRLLSRLPNFSYPMKLEILYRCLASAVTRIVYSGGRVSRFGYVNVTYR